MTARDQLNHGLLGMAEEGRTTPCQGRRRSRWTSDDSGEREWAASVCASLACPLLAMCRDVGAEEKHKAGVWGGVDYGAVKRRRGGGVTSRVRAVTLCNGTAADEEGR